jgi:hypothetical protein
LSWASGKWVSAKTATYSTNHLQTFLKIVEPIGKKKGYGYKLT